MLDEEVENAILDLFERGKWTEVLELERRNRFLPWIWPRKSDLEFIGDCVREVRGKRLISIGCGSGLLEWLVRESTGIEVRGIEMDGSWWTSKYAKKLFVPVAFVEEFDGVHESASSADAVLLFCYFNNEKAFARYVDAFEGKCFIVIGPGPGKPAYTCPQPLSLPGEKLRDNWRMMRRREIGDTNDHIAAYVRRE